MAHIEDVLLYAVAQKGKKYRLGAEVTLTTFDSATEWDCSELVEVCCLKAGVDPKMPDIAYNQWKHCNKHGLGISVQDAMATRGALLFVGDGTGTGRDAITHVALSLGDGTTIEAMGKAYGVGIWGSKGRFDFGGLIPGVAYDRTHPPLTQPPAARVPDYPGVAKRGKRGPVVRAYQSRLHDIGYGVVVDGDFGPKTEQAVKAFQKKAGLTVDGIAGRKTWTALWRDAV